MKAQLRATIEQYETQVEEAKASNEELQATNEELRSAAEELETSKEELQSVNEELTTVNQELKIKIEELAVTNNNFQNLINSTEIGTIFLDRLLRVKLSTPGSRDIFNLLPLDAGRPLSDITSNLVDDQLKEDAEQVLQHLQTVEREVRTRRGPLVSHPSAAVPDDPGPNRGRSHDVSRCHGAPSRRVARARERGAPEAAHRQRRRTTRYSRWPPTARWPPGTRVPQRVFGYTEAEDRRTAGRYAVHARGSRTRCATAGA